MITASNDPWVKAAPVLLSVLRIVTGLLFMQHGAQKLFGMFGGSGEQRSVRPSIIVGQDAPPGAVAPQEQAGAVPAAEGVADGYLLPADASWGAALDQAAAERAEAERLAAEQAAAAEAARVAAAQKAASKPKSAPAPKKAAPQPIYRDDDDDDEWDDDDDEWDD